MFFFCYFKNDFLNRYIGDMFAWIHQSIPIERENLLLLLKDCDKNDLSEQSQVALTHIADGVCHALKVRVETILNGCTDVITLYSVSNLIRFYQTILKQVSALSILKQVSHSFASKLWIFSSLDH